LPTLRFQNLEAKKATVLKHLRPCSTGKLKNEVHISLGGMWGFLELTPTSPVEEARVTSTLDELRVFTNASLTAHGLSFETSSNLLSAGVPVLAAVKLLPRGVGSPDTVQRDTVASTALILKLKFEPLVREAVALDLPVAVAMDESPGSARGAKFPVVLVQFCTPMMKSAEFVDVAFLNNAADNVAIRALICSSLTQKGLFTSAELNAKLVDTYLCGDHASYMLPGLRKRPE